MDIIMAATEGIQLIIKAPNIPQTTAEPNKAVLTTHVFEKSESLFMTRRPWGPLPTGRVAAKRQPRMRVRKNRVKTSKQSMVLGDIYPPVRGGLISLYQANDALKLVGGWEKTKRRAKT
jgi:hypothetical protein